MAHGAQCVGLAGAGQSEGQDVDASLHKVAVGQLAQLLLQCQGHTVVLEGLPSLAGGQPGCGAQPADAALPAVLGLLLQHFQQGLRASPCPAAVNRETDCAPMVGNRNWWHSSPIRT